MQVKYLGCGAWSGAPHLNALTTAHSAANLRGQREALRAPAVASEVTYDDLDIADGGEASAAFYRIVADPTLAPEGRDELRESLLRYCARDTLALAYVHHWLMKGS